MKFQLSEPERALLQRLLAKYRDAMADLGQTETTALADGLLSKLAHPMHGGVGEPDQALYGGNRVSGHEGMPMEERLALGNANSE